MNDGFVMIDREIFEDDYITKKPFCRLGFISYLYKIAIYKPQYRDFFGTDIWLEKGDVGVSLRSLESQTGWDKEKIRTFLKRLEKRDIITIKTQTPITIFNIKYLEALRGCEIQNPDSNQTPTQTPTQTVTRQEPDRGQTETQTQPNKGIKKERNKKDLSIRFSDLDFSVWPTTSSQEQQRMWWNTRKLKKVPITQDIVARHGKKLAKLKAMGFNVEECLQVFLDNGWMSPETRYFERRDDLKEGSASVSSHPSHKEWKAPSWMREERSGSGAPKSLKDMISKMNN